MKGDLGCILSKLVRGLILPGAGDIPLLLGNSLSPLAGADLVVSVCPLDRLEVRLILTRSRVSVGCCRFLPRQDADLDRLLPAEAIDRLIEARARAHDRWLPGSFGRGPKLEGRVLSLNLGKRALRVILSWSWTSLTLLFLALRIDGVLNSVSTELLSNVISSRCGDVLRSIGSGFLGALCHLECFDFLPDDLVVGVVVARSWTQPLVALGDGVLYGELGSLKANEAPRLVGAGAWQDLVSVRPLAAAVLGPHSVLRTALPDSCYLGIVGSRPHHEGVMAMQGLP